MDKIIGKRKPETIRVNWKQYGQYYELLSGKKYDHNYTILTLRGITLKLHMKLFKGFDRLE